MTTDKIMEVEDKLKSVLDKHKLKYKKVDGIIYVKLPLKSGSTLLNIIIDDACTNMELCFNFDMDDEHKIKLWKIINILNHKYDMYKICSYTDDFDEDEFNVTCYLSNYCNISLIAVALDSLLNDYTKFENAIELINEDCDVQTILSDYLKIR